MLLQCEALNLMNFKDDEERKKFIFDSINNNNIYKYLNEKIIDFDFCSCINKTTLEDDIISFKYHERTWDGQIPNMNEFLDMNPLEFDTYRLGITFLVRFLRFGGRKLAYKIIHKNAFDIRFKYDNPYYYFCMLPVFIEKINAGIISDYPVIFNCIQKIADCMDSFKIDGDYFEKSGIATMELNYSDVFPR